MSGFVATAAAAYRDEDLGADLVVLAEHADGSGRRIEIQRSLHEPTADDVAAGMDTYCLVTETGAVVYGGIVEWNLDGAGLVLRLQQRAARMLGVEDASIRITLAGSVDAAKIRRGVTALIDGGASGRARS